MPRGKISRNSQSRSHLGFRQGMVDGRLGFLARGVGYGMGGGANNSGRMVIEKRSGACVIAVGTVRNTYKSGVGVIWDDKQTPDEFCWVCR